ARSESPIISCVSCSWQTLSETWALSVLPRAFFEKAVRRGPTGSWIGGAGLMVGLSAMARSGADDTTTNSASVAPAICVQSLVSFRLNIVYSLGPCQATGQSG